MHGKSYTQDTILMYLESLIETYSHETPQTILLFLKKASNGDFGKFFGEPDIGTIREWFADFIEKEIIPARLRSHRSSEGAGVGREGMGGGPSPIKQIFTKVTHEKEFKKKGKTRNL